MKKIGDLLNVQDIAIAREEKQEKYGLDPMAVRLVEYVFAKFYMLCRGTDTLYADPKRLAAEKTQWQSTFTREGYTAIDHIRKALLKLERHRYPNPPQLGEFLAWNEASPDDLGLLTKEQAYNRAITMLREGDPKDISADQIMLIRLAIKETDSHFMRNNSQAKTQPLFQRNYEIVVRNFLDGKIKPVPKAIEDKQEESAEIKKQEVVQQGFDHLTGYEKAMPEIRRILGMNPDGNYKSTTK